MDIFSCHFCGLLVKEGMGRVVCISYRSPITRPISSQKWIVVEGIGPVKTKWWLDVYVSRLLWCLIVMYFTAICPFDDITPQNWTQLWQLYLLHKVRHAMQLQTGIYDNESMTEEICPSLLKLKWSICSRFFITSILVHLTYISITFLWLMFFHEDLSTYCILFILLIEPLNELGLLVTYSLA